MIPDTKSKKSKKSKKTKKLNITTTVLQSSNSRIINVLETVKSYYARERNTIHVSAYERAIYQLKKWHHPIRRGKDVAHLEGIGKGMVQKIDTILATGTLPIIQEKGLDDGYNRANKSLSNEYPISQVLGFSAKSAAELEKQHGIRSVTELEELVKHGVSRIKLTRIQQMGLRYHNDLREKVPREEITRIGNKIEDILAREGVMVLIAGSYPSGLKKESKDIDILLVVRDSSKLKSKSYLEELIQKLKTDIHLETETITIGANKFLGLVKLKDIHTGAATWRHLDMRLVDIHSFPYAWLYYASGVIFNKIIREKLKKKGYKLNEWGLFQDDTQILLEGEETTDELEKLFQNTTNTTTKTNTTTTTKTKTKNKKEDLLAYAEKIEKEIFKLAQLEYKTIQERY
jgi:DNA polymerase/3'-5' exonuclease PolX